jgi:hypothetical protein
MEQRQPTKGELILALLSMVITGLLTWYSMASPQEQYWLKLRALQSLHRLAGRLAQHEGRAGMGDELAGQQNYRYEVAYRASRFRDRLAKALEGMRL